MKAVIIEQWLSNKDIAEKIEKLFSQTKEMSEASLDASRCKEDLRKFLENLPEDKFMEIFWTLITSKEEKEEKKIQASNGCPQDLGNQDEVSSYGSLVQDSPDHDQLHEQPNQQAADIVQANRKTQTQKGILCSEWDVLQTKKNALEDQVRNLEQHLQQSKEQIAASEASLRGLAYQNKNLKSQLHTQNAASEQIIKTQHEDMQGYKKVIECLVKKNKKEKDELDIAKKLLANAKEEIKKLEDTLQMQLVRIRRKSLQKLKSGFC